MSIPEIEAILVKHDPIGLIRIGAPPDEYHGEAKKIYNSLRHFKKHPGMAHVQEVVAYVFNQAFKTGDDPIFGSWMHRSDFVITNISLDICALMDTK